MKALFGWLSYVALTVWVATGVLIALSPYFLVTPQNTTLNVVISLPFVGVGLFCFAKFTTTRGIWDRIASEKRFLFFETLSLLFAVVLGLLMLAMVLFRLNEGMAVFG